ncbi:MAG: D-glucuronyl C5-epimerase family protein [Methanothrix sp.]|uniref:D-glucuronyl C5-epimerase family protein n=1 Tax=Methanothrix sp. TaxID=90426 RepID=UPI0032AFCF71|nr:D-glucuronyl C5-epimerase family protein [Methanothrix sp.]
MQYLERANALARKVRSGMMFNPDGTMTMPYWVRDSLPYTGWKNRASNPVNGLYPECSPDPATEDVSHFTLTLRFMVEAWQMGIVFEDKDLEAVARTFAERLWRPSSVMADELCDPDWRKGFYLAHNLDGESQAYDYAAATFALLSRWDATILSHALEVYRSRYSDINCVDKDYLYGEVMLGWSVLAGGGELWMGKLQEKPLYPFTLRFSADQYVKSSRLISLDDSGVPVTDYGSLHGGAGKRYNPTFISNYALALYRDFLSTKDPSLLEAFNKQVHWLLEHKTQRQNRGIEFWVWEFDFNNPTFEAKAPWVSALSQGRVLSVFLAAYDLTNDPHYLRAAEYTFRSFLVPASEGGVSTFENNVAWYEEVADYDAPSAKILNGHIAAVQGLWTFWKWTGREDVKRYLDIGIAAVKRDIATYDAGFLSYYSQYPTNPRIYAPSGDYNTLHVHQLLWLYDATEESIFLNYALQFASYDSPMWNITTAGSTDPIGHGPDKLFFQMGSQFWSHNEFPTWVVLDLHELREIDGIAVFGYTNKSTPRNLEVLVSKNGKDWIKILERVNNTEIQIIESFEPVLARFVKLVIFNDNGNNNVALTGFAVLGNARGSIAVSDWKSFSSGNLPAHVFGKGWNIPEIGWIVVYLGDPIPKDIFIKLEGCYRQCCFTLLETRDLKEYRTISPDVSATKDGLNIALHNLNSSYLKIVFHGGCKGGKLTVRDFA